MLLAAVSDTSYEIVKALHILAAVAGVGPLLYGAAHAGRARRVGGEAGASILESYASVLRVAQIALGVLLLLGFALVGMSDEAFSFGDPWISASMLLLLIGLGLLGGLVTPATRRAAAAMRSGDGAEVASLEKKAVPATAVANVCFTIALFLMVLKPGG